MFHAAGPTTENKRMPNFIKFLGIGG